MKEKLTQKKISELKKNYLNCELVYNAQNDGNLEDILADQPEYAKFLYYSLFMFHLMPEGFIYKYRKTGTDKKTGNSKDLAIESLTIKEVWQLKDIIEKYLNKD